MQFKNLTWFFIASTALLLTGFLLSPMQDRIPQICILIWCNFIGVFLVYRLNDCIDQDKDLKFNLRRFFSYRLHQFVIGHFVLIVAPIAFYFLEWEALIVLSICAVGGLLYSINFRIGKYAFRLKNLFLIKNIMIGIAWGCLVLIGAGRLSGTFLIAYFAFASIQVFIGGMIRDIPDLEKDKSAGVRSFPVVFGVPATIMFMHTVNLASLLIAGLLRWDFLAFILFGGPVLWRLINLIYIGKHPENRFFSQWMNLFTCVVIFIMLLALGLYAII